MTIPKLTPYTGEVANPDGSQTQSEFTTNMFNQLSYEANLAAELDATIDGMNNAVDEVSQNTAIAESSANAAEAAASSAGYQGLWPDTDGSALKGETWQTQVGGTPTGEYYTALQNTSVDPVGDDVNWKVDVSGSYVNQSQEELINGSLFPVSGTVKNGDIVEPGTTHLRALVGGQPVVVSMSPISTGVVSLLTETSAKIGATSVTFEVETVKNFQGIQSMIDYPYHSVNSKVKTGATVWKITTSTKGWATSTTGLYALPLNGVWLTDAGADPLNGNDASDAMDLMLANFNSDNKRRFTTVLGGGDFNFSRQLALTSSHGRFRMSGGAATITATANMDSLITWPHIDGPSIKDIQFKLGSGITMNNAIIDGGYQPGDSNKCIRTKLRNLSAFNIEGSPRFIRMTQEWEFKLENIRSDHDVSGQTGTNIQLVSCVNGQIKTPEVGYSAVGIQFSKSADVSYQCEGIDLVSPVTTFAAIALKGDNITSLKVTGGVLDFCLTRAWEFTNGSDVSFFGTWFANRSDSAGSGSFGISQPTFNKIKLFGCHFVNNHPTNTWNSLSLNSPGCKLFGNTHEGNVATGLILSDCEHFGNSFIDSTRTKAITQVQSAVVGTGNAAIHTIESGENQNSADKFLSRLEFSAPQINAASKFQIDIFRGAIADQIYAQLGWNGAYKFKFEMASGDIRFLTPGRGIILTSPDGLTTKLVRLSNAGSLELI
ncbi:putative hemagglutinin protein [Vibrio phage P23]|nr:putative hemagglutinin protein [Vibrio phage P23]